MAPLIELYEVATLLPLYEGGIQKHEDIINTAEKQYLNMAHPHFNKEISSAPKSTGRKHEEWAINNSCREKHFLSRIKYGHYQITDLGKEYIEDFAAQSLFEEDWAEIKACSLFTDRALEKLESIYREHADEIATRQSIRMWKFLSNRGNASGY